MTMKGLKNKNSKLPESLVVLKLWIELGNLRKVASVLSEEGYNTRTGRPYDPKVLAKLVYRWCCENPEDAWIKYQEAGTTFNRDQWNRWLIRKAIKTLGYSRNTFLDWVKSHGLEQYTDVYGYRFPEIKDKRLEDLYNEEI